jgi:threonine dehydratase
VDGPTVLVLSGGNVGAGLLAEVARRHETQQRRRLVLRVRIPDLPGRLAELLGLVGRVGANLVDVQHIREGLDLHIQETAIQLVLETRGPEHAAAVHAAIKAGGYEEATEIR